MFSARLLEETDYPALCKWWKFWRFPIPPQDCLPDNGASGIMISKGGVDICAGFLYFTNSRLAWLEYVVSNFDYKESDRTEAIRSLVDELCFIAQSKGIKAVFTSVKNQNLIKHYEACNFLKNEGTAEMIKVLN